MDVRRLENPTLRRFAERLTRFNGRHPWSHNDHFHGWIESRLPVTRGSALDVGCGRGELLRRLSPCFNTVVGIDADADMVAAAADACADLSGAHLRRRLAFRYTLEWTAPG